MLKFRLICPECGAMIVTACPEAVVWELCPTCRRHMWDIHDARMADKIAPAVVLGSMERSRHAEN